MLEDFQGDSWGLIPPLRMSSLLPHDLCHGQSASRWPPTYMYRCESWTIKKAKCWRIDAFELWYWRTLLWAPWTARRSNQPILKEINLEYLLEGLMLKLQYIDPSDAKSWTHLKRPWCWERLRAGREGDDRGWDGWKASPTQWIWVWVNSRSWWWTESHACWSPWTYKDSDTTEQLNWTKLKYIF